MALDAGVQPNDLWDWKPRQVAELVREYSQRNRA